MTAIAYIANEFPSPLEPYVIAEIAELRRRGLRVVCCSGKRGRPDGLRPAERNFWEETHFFQPLSDDELMHAARRLTSDHHALFDLLKLVFCEPLASPSRRIRTLAHTLLGAALADALAPLDVEHIHAHHGYFGSWMALAAARLLGITFSFTLHGSDLLLRADLLEAKLRSCHFCVTVSDFNRKYILDRYPCIPASRVLVHRLGVDAATFAETPTSAEGVPANRSRFMMLSVGRLHAVKNYRFLIDACAILRDEHRDFLCCIAGDGPEHLVLARQIRALHLEHHVCLLGQVPRDELPRLYRQSDLVVLTSQSEGVPVALMEAMAHQRLVLAPAITGIPELVNHGRTGFLYDAGSMPDFLGALTWLFDHGGTLDDIRLAAAERIAASYDLQRNLSQFADQFLSRISIPDRSHEDSLLQQVQLSV